MMDAGFQNAFLLKRPTSGSFTASDHGCSPPPHSLRHPTYAVPYLSHA
ncbi:hypothetical protein RBSWK_03938 [Rhodopirellula baltica SWK14]|uniref:Uncharacterized protein n=1 Tax=Rhodopirellula baltica SWK14 TaxID=993516 RepID=L7CDD8_RHOBT|nr:hypothetical protein RBSWK_03938 [Rhodopirellula baltica SWK14]